MGAYYQIVLEEKQEELEALKKALDFYTKIEEDISPDEKRAVMVFVPACPQLGDFVGGRSMMPSQVIRDRIRVLEQGGENVGDLEMRLQDLRQAHAHWQAMESSATAEELFVMKKTSSRLYGLVQGKSALPTDIIANQIRKLIARKEDMVYGRKFTHRLRESIRYLVKGGRPLNSGNDIPHSLLTARDIEQSRSIAGYRRDIDLVVRSTWEANYARVLMYQGVAFRYEKESFRLEVPEGLRDIFNGEMSSIYVPDFRLADTDVFLEIKGTLDNSDGLRAASKIVLFKAQHSPLKLKVIGPEEYRDVEREFRGRINSDTRFCGWESGTKYNGDNLATNPEKFGKAIPGSGDGFLFEN